MKRDVLRGEHDKENTFAWNKANAKVISSPLVTKRANGENQRIEEDDTNGFVIKTVLRPPRSKSTIGGFTPKQKQNLAAECDNTAIEYQVKEELRGLEARFFGLGEPTSCTTSVHGDTSQTKEKKRRARRKSTKDDSLLSEVRSKSRAKKERTRKERPDFGAHTIDFSSLRKPTTDAAAAAATTSASASTISSDRPLTAEQPQQETPAAKPTRKGLRKGSLSRSLKIFQELFSGQEKDKETITVVPPPTPSSTSSSPLASLYASSPSVTSRMRKSPSKRRSKKSLASKDSSSPSSSPFATGSSSSASSSPASSVRSLRETPPRLGASSSPIFHSQSSLPTSGSPFSPNSSSPSLKIASRRRDRIRDADAGATSGSGSAGGLPSLPAEATAKSDASEDEGEKEKTGSGSSKRKSFALSLSSISAISFTNPLSARSANSSQANLATLPNSARSSSTSSSSSASTTTTPAAATIGSSSSSGSSSSPRAAVPPSHEEYDADGGLLWRVYEDLEEGKREVIAGRMPSIVGHIIEVACINDDGTVRDEDRLHRFLLSYTQWLSPDQMFSLLLGRYGFSEERLNPKTKRYVSSLASAPSYSLASCLDEDEEENLVLRRKIKTFLQEWIKVKYSTDFSTPLSKKVIILLNRAIREEKEEEKEREMERSIEAYLAEGGGDGGDDSDGDGFELDGDDWHMRVRREEASEVVVTSATPPQPSKKERKARLDRLDRFKDDMPSPYSPTSFSKKLGMRAGRNKLDAKQFAKVSVLALKSSKVARQLSRIDFGLFQKVTPTEFDGLAFGKDNKGVTSPNVKAMADRFNQVSYWVATEILKSPSPRSRQKTLQKFIAVASKLKKNGNFASFFAVGAGLNIHSVSRLKTLWEDLPQKYRQAFDDMMVLLNNTRNYQNYRSLFSRRMKTIMDNKASRAADQAFDSSPDVDPAQDTYPLIPYIGVFTRDFTFLHEGNANTVPAPSSSSAEGEPTSSEEAETGEKLVNYEKMELWGGLLLVLKKLQGQSCTIEGDLVIDNYLANFSPLTDNNLYHTSSSILQLER